MSALAITLLSVGGALAVFLALWLFLIAPRARKEAMKPFMRPYAHRGLWNKTIPENSLAAFDRAAENGFAIELDVQLSGDGVVMVFHDYTLGRMCGVDAKLADYTAAELGALALDGTEQTVPTLREVLDVVAGRVPLLIELKGESGNTAVVPATLAELADYKGEWCMESFNPLLLRAVKKQAPHVVRGLLSTDLIKEKKDGSRARNFALSALLFTFLCRPAFHAYDHKHAKRLALCVGIRLFGAAPVVYTIQSEADYNAYLDKGIPSIFEGFVPERK